MWHHLVAHERYSYYISIVNYIYILYVRFLINFFYGTDLRFCVEVDALNELIALTKAEYKDRFTVIGCGGVFSYEDAKKKFDLGAD